MDPRIKERRRGVAQARGRRRMVVAVALLLATLAGAGFLWVRSSDVFAVRRVSVPIAQRVTEEQLRAAVGQAAGINLLRVSTDAIEARLRAIPYVRAANVYRRFPDGLDVSIVEYEPVARLEGRDGGVWLLGDDGRVLGPAEEGGRPGGDGPATALLPLFQPEAEVWPAAGVVTAPQVVEALPLAERLGLGASWPRDRHPVDRILVAGSGEVVMTLAGGAEVRLGDPSQLDEKLMVALEVVDRYVREGKGLEYVDVHVPARVVAKAK